MNYFINKAAAPKQLILKFNCFILYVLQLVNREDTKKNEVFVLSLACPEPACL